MAPRMSRRRKMPNARTETPIVRTETPNAPKETPSAWQNGVRFAVYALLAAISAALSAVFVCGIHSPDGPEDGYFGGGRYLLIAALVLLGGGIVFYREYAKQHPAFRGDALLVTVTGAVLLLCFSVLWVSYGALQPPFAVNAYMAVNLRVVLLSLLPLPFTVRLFTLIPARGNATQRFRHVAWTVALLLVLGLVVLTVLGGSWAMLPLSV